MLPDNWHSPFMKESMTTEISLPAISMIMSVEA